MAEMMKASPDQRVKIRGLLDKHFDDGIGRYLDGYSDEKVANSVGVPRMIVEQIREVGYGPIKEDPALVLLRAELERAKTLISDIEKRLKSLEGK